LLAHHGISGPAPFVAVALLLVGMGALVGAGWTYTHASGRAKRLAAIGLGAVGVGCLVLGTVLPLFLGAQPSLARPSSTARIGFVSPAPGAVFHGDPATIDVSFNLEGGQVVPFTSLRLVPNEGHIHLYLDGALVTMTSGLSAVVTAGPGQHELDAEFVAVDHGPFDPRVRTSTTFSVEP
jgi:hypothetical protein